MCWDFEMVLSVELYEALRGMDGLLHVGYPCLVRGKERDEV